MIIHNTKIGKIRIAVVLWMVVAAWLCVAPVVGEELETPGNAQLRKWALTVYGGIGTDGGIEDIPVLEEKLNDAYMLDVACSREVACWRDRLALEVEGQVAQHFKKQDHSEGNLLLAARWMKFPWNDHVRTSIAIGEGISYASSIPAIEKERSPDKTANLLNYVMLELEVGPPKESRWSIVTRIHHRSGVFGLYDGVSKGSNLLGAGVRCRL